MKQDSDSNPISHSTNTNQSPETRRQRIDKNRAIRKDKIKNKRQNEEDSNLCLTREERSNLQKVRNREAAQRSREMHKEYVHNLEQENKSLKSKLNRNHYCKRCQRELSTDEENQNNYFMKIEEEDDYLNKNKDNFNEPRIGSILDFEKINDEESPFVRVTNQRHDSSLGLFLLIAMLCLGVFMVTDGIISAQPIHSNTRDLMSIHQIPQKQSQISTKTQTYPQIPKLYQQMASINSPATLSHTTLPYNQRQCLKSLINSSINSNPPVPRNLRGIRNMKSENNILFCQMPKVYRPIKNSQTIFSRLIDIIVRGSEIMEIVTNSKSIELNKLIEVDSFYRINAQVKSIVELQDHHCLV